MNSAINNFLVNLNNIGKVFWQYSASAFIQSSVLIILLLIVDFILKRRVRAVFRYCVWMLVFVKLVLPPSFSLPTGIGYWWGGFEKGPVISTLVPDLTGEGQETRDDGREMRGETPSAVTSKAELSKVITESAAQTPAVPDVLSLPQRPPMMETPLSWQAVVFVLWLVGVLIFSVLLIQRVFFVRGLIAQSSPAESSLCKVLQQCRQQLGLRRNIQIRLSDNTSSPAVCGLFRPVILMPKTLLAKFSQDKLRAVLVHELAHIKRGDLWVNLVQTILQVIYFYNPFVWLTNATVRRIREQAVDEMVLVALGAEAKSYSNTLIDIAEMAFWRANFSLRLIGVAESKKSLEGRIKHILTRPMPKSAKLGVLGLLTVIVMAAVLLPMAAAEDRGQKPALSEVEGTDDRVEKQFVATLPNGVMIELIGLCEHPSEGKQWWRPDGIILSQAPYHTTGSQSTDEKEGYVYYEFALKLSHPDRMSYFWMIPGSGHGSDTGSPRDESGHQIQALKAYATNLLRKQKITTVCIGTTAAEWQTIVKYKPEDLEENYSVDEFAIAFGTAYLKGNQTLLPVVHNYNLKKRQYAVRVIAITKSGQVKTSGYSGSGGNKLNSLTYIFNELPLETVKEFQFQTRPYKWITFKNVSLQPGVQTDVQIEMEKPDVQDEIEPIGEKEQAADSVSYAWQRTDRYVPPNPEEFFPDDPQGGKQLDALFDAVDKDRRTDKEILSTVRQGFRRTTQHRTLTLRWIGNKYIWNKQPQNPEAVEIMYHAVPMERHYAIYFGLSVLQPKTPNVMRTLAEVCMQGEDVGRITWGTRSQRDELVSYIEPYLENENEEKREMASILLKHFRGEIDFEKWKREKFLEQKKMEFGDRLPELRNQLLAGDSQTRREVLALIQGNGIGSLLDDSFLDAMNACAEDEDPAIRSRVARIAGNRWVWSGEENERAIQLMLKLSRDEDRDTRYGAVYHGLSTVRNKSEAVVRRLVELALADHENNLYGRIVWGLSGPMRADKELLERILAEQLDEEKSELHHQAALYLLYRDVLKTEPPRDWDFEEVKEHYPEDVFMVYFSAEESFQPESEDELWEEFSKNLPDSIDVQRLPNINPRQQNVIFFKVRGEKASDAVKKIIENNPNLRLGQVIPFSIQMQLFFEEMQGQVKANKAEAQVEVLKQIETITDVLIQAFNAGDIDTILSYYTDDGMSLPDQHEAAIGKGALHKLQLEAREEGVKIHSIKGLEQQVWDCGDFIFEAGRCVASLKSPKLRYLLSDWRKYVTVWIRQPDGSLKIKLDSWNPDVIPASEGASDSTVPVVTVVASETHDNGMNVIYEQIKQYEVSFHKMFIERDSNAATKFYADNAVLMPWGTNMVKGKTDILEHIKKGMNESPLVDMNQHVVHIEGNDQMLFAVNLFSWTFKDESSGQNVNIPGKGVHIWKRQQDGSWKILLDLHNPSVPMQQ